MFWVRVPPFQESSPQLMYYRGTKHILMFLRLRSTKYKVVWENVYWFTDKNVVNVIFFQGFIANAKENGAHFYRIIGEIQNPLTHVPVS